MDASGPLERNIRMTENMQESEIKGRDISAPVDSMELDGVTYALRHDMNSFRIAEDVYELYYGRNVSFGTIALHLAAGRIGAIMAVLYGALASAQVAAGKVPMTWKEFYAHFKLLNIPGFKEQLLENVKKALPEVDPKAQGADDSGDPQ